MFGKLMKHEFRATGRLVPFIWLATFVMAILNLISGQIDVGWLAGVSMFLLILLAVAQVIVTYVIVITRYYRSLYTDEGYLTHTLPVKAGSLLGSKVLVSYIWIMLSFLVALLVVLVIMLFFANKTDTNIVTLYQDFMTVMGFETKHVIIAAILLVLYASYAVFLQLSQFFFSMSFGSQARFHKLSIAGPIITYLIVNFILQIMMLIAMLFIPLGLELPINAAGLPILEKITLVPRGMNYLLLNPETEQIIFGLGGILFSFIAMAAMYWGSYYIIKKRTSLR